MTFFKFVDLVLLSACSIREARERRANPPPPADAPKELVVRPCIPQFRKWLLQQPAGALFMLLAIITIGRRAWKEFDLLALYCYFSDTVHTPRSAVERIIGTKELFDDLRRGLGAVERSGIDLDQWMATPDSD
jgi:hypothetical protein